MSDLKNVYLQGEKNQPAILLMHSLSDSHQIMWPLAQDLNQAGYSVLCPDFSSHEEGDLKEVMATSFDVYQADGERFYSYLKDLGHSKILVAGMSLGALVSFNLACQHADLEALISISTPIFTDLSKTSVPRFIRNRYFASLDRVDKKVRDESQPLFDAFENNLKTFNRWMDEMFTEIRRLTLPVLILEAEEDEVMPQGIGERLSRVLSESEVTFIQYSDASHYLTEERTYPAMKSDILEFLDRQLS